jgi:cytochrome c5
MRLRLAVAPRAARSRAPRDTASTGPARREAAMPYAILAPAHDRGSDLRQHDQQFFDTFMLVIGILMGVAVGLFFLARLIAIDTQGTYVLGDPEVQAAIAERIRPIGEVALISDVEAEAAAPAAAPPVPVETTLSGPQVYNAACYLCHSPPGVGGAPVLGDMQAWAPRAEQDLDVLIDHAINGYMGEAGFMPAKGGRVDLSDEEVVSAVEYMLEQADVLD